jgi:hypothetical protein
MFENVNVNMTIILHVAFYHLMIFIRSRSRQQLINQQFNTLMHIKAVECYKNEKIKFNEEITFIINDQNVLHQLQGIWELLETIAVLTFANI